MMRTASMAESMPTGFPSMSTTTRRWMRCLTITRQASEREEESGTVIAERFTIFPMGFSPSK